MNRKLPIMTMSAALVLSGVSIGLAQKAGKHKHHKGDKTEQSAEKSMIGKDAPDFTLKDVEGKSHALKDLKGQIVILEWANKDCPIWKMRMDTLQSSADKYKDNKNVTWLAIDSTSMSGHDESSVAAFNKENKITRPTLVDFDGKVGHAYDARNTPHMFVIDKQGKIAYDGALDNASPQSHRKSTDKDYVNYVTKAADELLAGKTVSTPSTDPYGCNVKYKKS